MGHTKLLGELKMSARGSRRKLQGKEQIGLGIEGLFCSFDTRRFTRVLSRPFSDGGDNSSNTWLYKVVHDIPLGRLGFFTVLDSICGGFSVRFNEQSASPH